ncbi:MAG: hypothetical protein GY751_13485 [Bacteroidetes bacterium]|nr:hypothetical protein [Bacteroidota bacterium]
MSKEVILKKYKHLMGVSEESLEFLKKLDADEMNALFLQTADAINGGQTELWEKLAKGSHLMPAFIAAKLSENVFGEVICANVASYMRIKDALRVIKHMSVDFMAKTTPHMIPEKTVELVNAIPLRTNRKVTRILLKEQDYYTIARFVDTLEFDKVMTMAKEDIKDERVLLKIATFVENKTLVAKIFMAFSDKQKLNIMRSGYGNEFSDEMRNTINHLSKDDMRHLHSIISGLPEDVRKLVDEDLSNAY